jgi:hypothetical protein
MTVEVRNIRVGDWLQSKAEGTPCLVFAFGVVREAQVGPPVVMVYNYYLKIHTFVFNSGSLDSFLHEKTRLTKVQARTIFEHLARGCRTQIEFEVVCSSWSEANRTYTELARARRGSSEAP